MRRPLPPPLPPSVSLLRHSTERKVAFDTRSTQSPASLYATERDRAAAKVIFESMNRRLHQPRVMERTENDFDPHDW